MKLLTAREHDGVPQMCSECNAYVSAVVQFVHSETDYYSSPVDICVTCLEKAIRLLKPLPHCGMPSHHESCDCDGVGGDR